MLVDIKTIYKVNVTYIKIAFNRFKPSGYSMYHRLFLFFLFLIIIIIIIMLIIILLILLLLLLPLLLLLLLRWEYSLMWAFDPLMHSSQSVPWCVFYRISDF